MHIERRPLQGVLNILSFNRHFYYYGLAGLVLLMVVGWAIQLPTLIIMLVVAAFAYGLLMPLIISAYVYDLSGYYNMEWLRPYVRSNISALRVLNINAGFDETSHLLANQLPGAEIQAYDFYDDSRHTEPAIVRARKVSLVYPNTKPIVYNKLPDKDNTIDIVFVLSAAHEIRRLEEKVAFLSECRRVCKPTGQLIMVEHLRDWPNFVAFTIGFTHFFSSKVWRSALLEAGFSHLTEEKFTPFMSIFNSKP